MNFYKTCAALIAMMVSINSFATGNSASDAIAGSMGLPKLPNCRQIYLSDPKVPGTEEQCKKNWDYFSKINANCALAIMALNGLGGQPANPQKALEYANKIKNSDNANDDICGVNIDLAEDEITTRLIDDIKTIISDPQAGKLSYCDLVVRPNEESICQQWYLKDHLDALNDKLKRSANTLSSNQDAAFSDIFNKYLLFVKQDNKTRLILGQFQGSGYAMWSNNSEAIMWNYYEHAMNNLLKHYPDSLKTQSSLKNLDEQLNHSYKTLIKLIEQIPSSNSRKKQLQLTQRAWLRYRDAYVHFAQLYYGNQYKEPDIKQITTAYLTRRRLAELNDQVQTVNGNLQDKDEDGTNFYTRGW